MSDPEAERRRAYQMGRNDERTEILSIVLSAIHNCRLLKQNTSQLEEVKAAIKARGATPAPTPSSAAIPIISITRKPK